MDHIEILPAERTAPPAIWSPTFAVAIDEMVARVEAKHDFFRRVMREGDHYGTLPGGSAKQVLLKPGAELLLASMGLFVELSDAEPPVRDYGGDAEEGIISYRRRARIYRQTGPQEHERMLVAQAEGFCTSRETKYRYRDAQRRCPICGEAAIIKGKTEYGGGWLCFKKRNGCGAKFDDTDAAILGQSVGRIPNPDLADTENTILKMADKRALVAAALIATGCSDIFTQDLEEIDAPEKTADAAPPKPTTEKTTLRAQAADHAARKRELWTQLCALDADPRLDPNARLGLYMGTIGKPNRDGLKDLRDPLAAIERLIDVYAERGIVCGLPFADGEGDVTP